MTTAICLLTYDRSYKNFLYDKYFEDILSTFSYYSTVTKLCVTPPFLGQ